jgi:hypothetical protein
VAVYRCEVRTLGRASGRSAVAAVAYRSATRLRDERSDKTHDYRRRTPGVVGSGVLTPESAPAWAHERRHLWNQAEAAETRKNAVVAREVVLSLPHELTDAQRVALVREFGEQLVERYGVAVDFAVHRPDRKGDQRNHHAHVMMTTRRLEADGFTEKTRELDDLKGRGPQEVEAIRQLWQDAQNSALELAGSQERVSRLSNKARGIEREPEPKLGEAANALLRRGEPSRRGELVLEIRVRNTMRENMAKQREKQEAVARALEAARRVEQEQQPGATPTFQEVAARPSPAPQAALQDHLHQLEQRTRELQEERRQERALKRDKGLER